MNYAIEVKDLRKRFGFIEALKGITFYVKEGEKFGFLGPNGAGKSTTIHILTTLLKPDEGEVKILGHKLPEEAKQVRKLIGVVFQDPALDNYLSAYENLYIHGRLYGLKGSELRERIIESLKFFDLYEHKDRIVMFFSGGMRRRLEIARALMHKPKVLFLDEPTVGLDPQSRAKVWEYIERVNKEYGITIFLTTHYMDEADKLCDRIAIIDHGRIIAQGTPDELKRMVGKEVIYVKTELPPKCPEGFDCETKGNQAIVKADNAAKILPELIELMKPYKILEVNLKKPTLDDVFLALTGRELRDELGSAPVLPFRRW
ncbi:ABC transporter ATP-binding protein [Ignicoccus islandicus DSM 13165]|uniref:ABC transporter ATP-binding protein n=1 Tax=Ignicoccus islandicus DSM 13165 TaxID=940295 RepID=A0A0U3F319_9CREN|nr:ATP-binding cassette domain-containing protein [Ignicoccus islandicus]ALU11925.1 ABC transporter ATP-binding protein [Ignicoccus islandicus DSM 13165]